MRYQLMLDPKNFQEVIDTLQENKFRADNESRYIEEALKKYLNYENNVSLTLHSMELVIKQLRDTNNKLNLQNAALQNEIQKVNQERTGLEIENKQLVETNRGLLNEAIARIRKKKRK